MVATIQTPSVPLLHIAEGIATITFNRASKDNRLKKRLANFKQANADRWCAVSRSKLKALTKLLQAIFPSLSGQFNAVVKAWNHKQGE